MTQRSISAVTQNSWHQGFLGSGHSASAILENIDFKDSDPFIVFMDDKLDLPGGPPVGGAHPHAGIETLTLVLEGNGHEWQTGSFELMTAGKGIVHTEEITTRQQLRILQVWLVLPPEKRWALPFLQRILLEDVPTIKNEQYEIRVYSGSSNGLTSPIKNHTPFTLVDYRMNKLAEITQQIPAGYNGLVYVLEGSVSTGDKTISEGQVGWLNQTDLDGESEVSFITREKPARFVLYAGQPHNVPVVQHGPFVADKIEDIPGLYKSFREGKMPHLSELPESQRLQYSKQHVVN